MLSAMKKAAKLKPNERIRLTRKSWQMNQAQFGEAIGKSLRSIQCYEDGTTSIPESVEKLIDYMAKEREAATV
mgnify:CR=1 FL=1